jgi:hypothetical protein
MSGKSGTDARFPSVKPTIVFMRRRGNCSIHHREQRVGIGVRPSQMVFGREETMQFRMRQMCLFAVVLGEEPQRLQQLMPE